ncbi:MAG: DUF2085 domain-containing protein [Coriobacteriia bacterium]|nr:DUF2085 domain-containing protein [Coriobacteriia bacterium]
MQQLFDIFGYGLCHQLPERSLFAGGFQLPVCARDTGIYLGFVVSLALIALLSRHKRPTELPSLPVLILGGIFVSAMAVDGITFYVGMRTTTNDLRILTGLLAGYALPLVAVPIVNSQMWRITTAQRPLNRVGDVLVWLASLPLAFVMLRTGLKYLGIVYPLLVVVAVLVTFVSVNLVFVCFVPRFDRAADRLRDAWPQLFMALGLTIIQLAAAGALRLFLEGLA